MPYIFWVVPVFGAGADLVGDNVGDCAGRGADLFESTTAENIGAMILATVVFAATRNVAWILFPLVVRAFGLVSSMIGVLSVRPGQDEDPMHALNRGYYVALILSVVGLLISVVTMLGSWWLFGAGLVGILANVAVVHTSQYYTEARFRPVRSIVEACRTGPATNIVAGTIAGILMASFMNNAGGAWDNAKKYIEDGRLKDENGNVLGKGSAAHAAAVVGDTVGDPFKDTAGPSLHVLVKLLSTITLVMSPLFI